MFGSHVAEVIVDTNTGEVAVQRIVAAHDVGKAINPREVSGQIEGGVAQGLGMALMEEVISRAGEQLNANFTDYIIPTIVDVPPIEAVIVERAAVARGPLPKDRSVGDQARDEDEQTDEQRTPKRRLHPRGPLRQGRHRHRELTAAALALDEDAHLPRARGHHPQVPAERLRILLVAGRHIGSRGEHRAVPT